MATINPRCDKNGNIISYQIRVFRGRDSSGKRLKDYMMTWHPDPSMTKRQIEREVQRQATLFEENCRLGNVSTEKITFERYAAYVVDLKERAGLKAKTVERYRDMLPRINAEIGPLKLQDIRADHLNRLYAKLAAEGENKTGARAVAKIDLKAILKDKKLRQARIVERTGVSSTTVSDAIKGHTVSTKTAQAVANAHAEEGVLHLADRGGQHHARRQDNRGTPPIDQLDFLASRQRTACPLQYCAPRYAAEGAEARIGYL